MLFTVVREKGTNERTLRWENVTDLERSQGVGKRGNEISGFASGSNTGLGKETWKGGKRGWNYGNTLMWGRSLRMEKRGDSRFWAQVGWIFWRKNGTGEKRKKRKRRLRTGPGYKQKGPRGHRGS